MSPPFRITTPKGRVLEAKDLQELIAELRTSSQGDLEAAEYAEDLAGATGNTQTKRLIDLLATGMRRCGDLKRDLASHLQERLFPMRVFEAAATARVIKEAQEQRRQDILKWWAALSPADRSDVLAAATGGAAPTLAFPMPFAFEDLPPDVKNAVTAYAVRTQRVPLVPHA